MFELLASIGIEANLSYCPNTIRKELGYQDLIGDLTTYRLIDLYINYGYSPLSGASLKAGGVQGVGSNDSLRLDKT